MPTNKDFKRLVRGRMQRTGEAYTTARAHLLSKQSASKKTAAGALRPEFATLAGMSDAAIKAKTGCTWERWVHALDDAGAHEWPHRTIARYVQDKFHVPDWWCQTVTVGYERIKGLRAIGQRRGGGFEATKSKVFPASLTRLYRAWHDARLRARWLDVSPTIRSATKGKYMHITWPDGSSVDVGFFAKGKGKAQVAVQHSKLPDRAAAVRTKSYWAERFAALGALLAS